MATMADPAFLEEAEKLKLTIDPLPGEKVAAIVHRMADLDPAVVARMKQVLEQE